MRQIVRLLVAAALSIHLGGCAGELAKLKAGYDVVISSTSAVTPEAIVLARSAFNAAEVLATNYMRLPRCNGSNGPLCRDPSLRARIDDAVYAGRRARNTLADFQRDHPGQLGPSDTYDALVAATAVIKNLTGAYRAAIDQ